MGPFEDAIDLFGDYTVPFADMRRALEDEFRRHFHDPAVRESVCAELRLLRMMQENGIRKLQDVFAAIDRDIGNMPALQTKETLKHGILDAMNIILV